MKNKFTLLTDIAHFFKKTIKSIVVFFANLCLKPFMVVRPLPVNDINTLLPNEGVAHLLFILKTKSILDEIALKKYCHETGLKPIVFCYLPEKNNELTVNLFFQQLTDKLSEGDNTLMPVSIFWGRMPGLGEGFWKSYLSDNWAVASIFRRFLTVITQIKQIHCYFGARVLVTEDLSALPLVDKYRFIGSMNDQLIRQKEAVVGPDLSHQRIIADKVLKDDAVRQVIDENPQQAAKSEKKAHAYIHEIASDYSYTVVRFFDYFLTRLWQKIYQGIEIRGLDRLQAVAEEHEIIYVPCHRSHIDYLLLSYVIYKQGLMPPHIAAGLNLNLPFLGKLLRRGGAFFIRRTFKDNPLYKAVLESYIAIMCQEGFSIEYFIEGGRSRTGLLLQPRIGMLSMTLSAAAQNSKRPLIFVPVYIGYEKIFESHSYIEELYGAGKKKESIASLLSMRKYLKQDYGKVYMNIGKPITLPDVFRGLGYTDEAFPGDQTALRQFSNHLGEMILIHINASASVTAMNLIAISLLASPRYALLDRELKSQMLFLGKLCLLKDYEQNLQLYDYRFDDAVNKAVQLNLVHINLEEHSRIVYLDKGGEISATFLRNNNLHIFVLPSLIASILVVNSKVTIKRLKYVCKNLYPYLKSELFLPWAIDEIDRLTDNIIKQFFCENRVQYQGMFLTAANEDTSEYHSLLLLSKVATGNFQRFYITTQLLYNSGNKHYTQATLVDSCVLVAKQLSFLHECHEPDFFDKNLFKTFTTKLIDQGLIKESDGYLVASKHLGYTNRQAKFVLPPAVRRSIGYVTQSTMQSDQ